MDFVWKLYGNTYAVHVTVALVGVATLNLALPAPPVPSNVSAPGLNPQQHHQSVNNELLTSNDGYGYFQIYGN